MAFSSVEMSHNGLDAMDARGDQQPTSSMACPKSRLGTLHMSQNVTMSLTNRVLRGLKNGAAQKLLLNGALEMQHT